MTETASAEMPTPPRRRFRSIWNQCVQVSAKAKRYAKEQLEKLRRKTVSLGRRGGRRVVRAAQVAGRAGKVTTNWLAVITGLMAVFVLCVLVEAVTSALLLAIAALISVVGALALFCVSVYLAARESIRSGREMLRRKTQPEPEPAEPDVRAPSADELVQQSMDALLERKHELDQMVAEGSDDTVVGQQAFLDFLLKNHWAVIPAEENRAWAAAVRDHGRNGHKKAALRQGFLAERDFWAQEIGIASRQAA